MAQKFTVPITVKQLASAGSDAVTVYVDADTYARLKIEAGGRLTWGSGSATGDVNLYRDSADVLKTDDTFKVPALFVDSIEVDTTGATTNQVLKFDGTKFAPGTASTVGSIDDLSDVDTSTTAPTTNQYLKWNGTNWVPATVSAGGIIISDTAPSSPTSGQIWFESDTAQTFVYYDSSWIEIGASSITASVQGSAPASPVSGQIWLNSSTNIAYIYYGSSWIDIGAASLISTINAKGDIYVGTADNTVAALTVGSADQVLTVDSSTATGLKWASIPTINSLDDIADVTITSAANGDLLKWNGTAWVNAAGYALLASPTFTGTPTLPTGTIATTQTASNNSTAIATTAYVDTADALKANLASPTFTGTPTLPTGTIATTQTAGNNTTAVATTAFVTTAVSGATVVVSSATAPVSPTAGLVWFNTSTGASYIYYNSAWVELGGGTMSPYQVTSPTRPASPWTGQTIYETDTKIGYQYDGTNWGPTYPGSGFRNAIINGDFRINQRGFTSATTFGTFGHDRWVLSTSSGTSTYTTPTFALGNAITGYEPTNFAQVVSTGQSGAGAITALLQKIEDVRTFAGQTVTISFWAKTTSGTPKVAVELIQEFGTAGSPSSNVLNYAGQVTLSTSWTRYSVTVAVPSISGKTLGTDLNSSSLTLILWSSAGSNFDSRTGTLGIQSTTVQYWGVQIEKGPAATPFEQRPIGVELALCQRYYWRISGATAPNVGLANGFGTGSTTPAARRMVVPLPVSMRAKPTVSIGGTHALYNAGLSNRVVASLGFQSSAPDRISVDVNSSVAATLEAGVFWAIDTSSANDYLEASAEL